MKAAGVALAVGLLLAACEGTASPTATPAATELQAGVAASELVVGPQRVPIGISDHNTPISDATVHVRAFLFEGNNAVFKADSDAPFKGAGLEGAGLYIAHFTFDVAGNWGVEVTASRPNGAHLVTRLPINVEALPTVPGVGQPAPLSHNLTIKDVADVGTIDTGNPPDDMHQLSIADAIAQHRPTLVVFASPAFCTSNTCGPQIKVVQALEPAYRNRLTFIHVEIYRDYKPDPSKKQIAQTVVDWRLQSEPWIFLIDTHGVIQTRFEAVTAADDLKAALDQLLP